MSTVFFTDSTADLTEAYLQEHNLQTVSLTVQMNGQDYISTGDKTSPDYIDPKTFYDAMRNGATPTTAQVNQSMYTECFEEVLAAGNDVFYIGFSGGLSGSVGSAQISARELREKYPERKIYVVDTLAASLGEGMVVHLALQKHYEGMSDADLEKWLETAKFTVHHWFTVDDLVYLKRGGRVSAAAAMIGGMLNIKPVLNVDDEGHLIAKEKVKGRKRGLKALVDHMADNVEMPYTGPIFLSHGDCLEECQIVADEIKERFGRDIDMINTVTPVIGAHSGPGTMALFFVGNKPRG